MAAVDVVSEDHPAYGAVLADPPWKTKPGYEGAPERHYPTLSTEQIATLRVSAYGALLCDPPWEFKVRSEKGNGRSAEQHYDTLSTEQIKALSVTKYGALLLDPPWKYDNGGPKGGVDHHYATMTQEQLGALPIGDLAARNSVLFLWVTYPKLPEGLEVMRAWGFKFSTVAFTWVKLNPVTGNAFSGLGYWTRCLDPQTEVFIEHGARPYVERVTLDELVRRDVTAYRVWTPHGWASITGWAETYAEATEIRTRLGSVVASPTHTWPIKRLASPRRLDDPTKRIRQHVVVEATTAELVARMGYAVNQRTTSVNLLCAPVVMEPTEPVVEFEGFPLDADTGWFLGLFLAEGSYETGRQNAIRFTTHGDEEHLRARLSTTVERWHLFSERYQSLPVRVRHYQYPPRVATASCISSAAIYGLVKRVVQGDSAATKRLDLPWLYQTTGAFRRGLLDGFLAGDGRKGAYGYAGFLGFALCNECLVDDICRLSRSLGVMGHATKTRKNGHRKDGQTVYSYGFKFNTARNQTVKFEGCPVQPVALIGAHHSPIARRLIDLTVEGGWFIANDIITHNSNAEICLLGKRGKPKRLNNDVQQLIVAPRREHSRKPEQQYQRIERLVAGPYCEIFARCARPGWASLGNEVGKFEPAPQQMEFSTEAAG